MLNRVVLMGRLTKEPELRQTPGGVPVCTFTLAVDRDYARQGEQRETDFIDIVAWRQTAEFVSRWFKKGLLVAVDGKLQSRKWKDKYDQSRVSFEVIADNCHFAERAQSTAEAAQAAPAQARELTAYTPLQQSRMDFTPQPVSQCFAELGPDDDVLF